ncbi:MAG TPA: hypothetical protein VM537_06445, partial [Anaerolineae bacterium]|nr:hypothetical protein [Anaerolineae bacterium]
FSDRHIVARYDGGVDIGERRACAPHGRGTGGSSAMRHPQSTGRGSGPSRSLGLQVPAASRTDRDAVITGFGDV